ncbi:MAG: sigma-70 family RNA polymerase sigma factor [Ruminiclostridium sp.]|nr:sigma-70 family RNA polymerase sigma factor [Ruminiclostridium sp.]
MKVTDEELVGIIKGQADPMQSSETALLISRYSRVIRIKAAKLHTIDTDPEDLCQEGYLALFEAVRAFDVSKGTFSPFAGKCIENRMKNAVLKGRGRLEKDEDFDVTLIPDEGSAAEELVITKENDSEIVKMLLTHLTEKEYNALRLYIDGYSYKKIAEIMDITPKSADNALSRARKKLRELLL